MYMEVASKEYNNIMLIGPCGLRNLLQTIITLYGIEINSRLDVHSLYCRDVENNLHIMENDHLLYEEMISRITINSRYISVEAYESL